MNKELILKYKECFNHWLTGDKLLFKWTESAGNVDCWVQEDATVTNNLWVHGIEDILYVVINDEYVEFRKALAEGKTIQFKYTGESDYETIKCPEFNALPQQYRIKPTEPEFKVGDWVTRADPEYYIIGDIHIAQITDIVNKDYKLKLPNGYTTYKANHLKLWKPYPDDWCWFWDTNFDNEPPVFDQFKCKLGLLSIAKTSNCTYDHCEPFTGNLPSYLQKETECN